MAAKRMPRLAVPGVLGMLVWLAACGRAPEAGPAAATQAPTQATATATAGTASPARPPATAAPAPARGGETAIVDAKGFGAPMVAALVDLPAGWQSQGGVQWDRRTNCVANQMRLGWMAASADGRQAFELMHGLSWQVQGRAVPTNPCPVLPFASARDFLVAVVQQRRPGARLIDQRERPDLARDAAAKATAQPGMRSQHDAAELLVAWPAPAGEVQERFSATVQFTEVQGSVMGGTGMVVAQRALGGAPDAALGDRILRSMRPDPQWMAMVQQGGQAAVERFSAAQRQHIERWHAAEMARINAQGAADRAAIRAQTAQDVARIQSQTWADTQATNDRMHRRTLEGVGEYNTYQGSTGGPVRSSIHGGERVLRQPDGTVFSTNDPYLRPPGSEELRRVP